MKSKTIFFSIFSILLTSAVFASGNDTDDNNRRTSFPQTPAINTSSYSTAIGVRGFGTSGLTIKHFNSATNAIEGIIGFGPYALSATILFEKYVNAFDEPGLNWYYGFGGHIATQSNWTYVNGWRNYQRDNGDFGVGIDGIFGIEYKIHEIPIAISMDVKPFIEVTTRGNAYLALDPGLGVKFTF
ncbi:MAG: hypothetical protein ACI83W_002275 [Marinoscillum sp.]|jgi:hypothetical protein